LSENREANQQHYRWKGEVTFWKDNNCF